ncbi:hypothetical protein GCM10009743_31640 [Kribbella swartbergensis]
MFEWGDQRDVPGPQYGEVAEHQVQLRGERDMHQSASRPDGGKPGGECVDPIGQGSVAEGAGRVDEGRMVGIGRVGHQIYGRGPPEVRRKHDG